MTDKIKVALIIRGFHNGGIEKVYENYYPHMDLSKFEIHVVTHMHNIPEKKQKFEDMGCIVHEFSKMNGLKYTPQNVKEYRAFFRDCHFDVLHNNMPNNNFLATFYAQKYGVERRILHAHNVYTASDRKVSKLRVAAHQKLFGFHTAMATDLIGVSRAAGESVYGKKASEMLFLPNAINVEQFRFDAQRREQYRTQLGLGNSFVVGHIGRYERTNKNQEFALGVFQKLLEQRPDSRLLMLGDGTRLDEFKAMAVQMNIADKVIFTGNVQDVPGYLNAMDAFVLPSRQEGLGIVAIEAQTSGLYCCLSDKVPQEAKVTDRATFLPIGPGDQDAWVRELLQHEQDTRRDYSEEVTQAGYDVKTAAGKLEALYEGVRQKNQQIT